MKWFESTSGYMTSVVAWLDGLEVLFDVVQFSITYSNGIVYCIAMVQDKDLGK